MEEFKLGNGRKLVNVHSKSDCMGPCPIHGPSDHHMKDWDLNWRSDLGIFERICKCGVGHPDPDSLSYIRKTDPKLAESLSIHGCCRCCFKKE